MGSINDAIPIKTINAFLKPMSDKSKENMVNPPIQANMPG